MALTHVRNGLVFRLLSICALAVWITLLAGAAQAALVPYEVRFLPSPSSNVAGYKLVALDTVTGMDTEFDIGTNYSAPDAEGASSFEIQLEENRDHQLSLLAYAADGTTSAPSNAITANPGPAPQCAVDADCSDGDVCNGMEQCLGGTCQQGTPLVCTASGQCQVGRCDAQLGCVVDPAQDGTMCSDGNAGTINDMCANGTCTGLVPECFANSDCSDGNVCNGMEVCSNNSCMSGSPAANGTQCDDGNANTVSDMCSAGSCAGVVPECFADADCGDANVCNGMEQCVANQCQSGAPAADGSQCDDGNNGTVGDVCSAGVCLGAVPECFADADCGDANVCNGMEQCVANQCQSGAPAADGTQCDDGNADTVSDMCSAGVCAGETPACVADSDCADADVCNGMERCVANQCVSGAPAADGTQCDDGNANTVSDMCAAGLCAGEVAECFADADCADADVCNGAERCMANQCVSGALAADGTQCDDGDGATVSDMCAAGLCVGSVPEPATASPVAATADGSTLMVDGQGSAREIDRSKTQDLRPVWCDLHGDGVLELVVGQGKGSKGVLLIHVFDEAGNATDTQKLRAGSSRYRSYNGETRPACGDIDGDGKDELVVGFAADGQGWLQTFDDATRNFARIRRLSWVQPYRAHLGANPALGDVDGDGLDEVVLSYDGKPGWLLVLDDAKHGLNALNASGLWRGWLQPSGGGDFVAQGTDCTPALGDLDGDGKDEIVLGFGPGGRGLVQIVDDAQAGFAHRGWVLSQFGLYLDEEVQTAPTVGDVDGDGRNELVIGYGPHRGSVLFVVPDAMGQARGEMPGLPGGDRLDLGLGPVEGPLRPAIGK